MGAVYEAFDTSSEGTRYAIKFLPLEPNEMTKGTARKRFYREMNLGKDLRHPNIAHAIEFGEYEGMLFYVMDFVEGKDLGAVLEDGWDPLKDRANISRMIKIVREICLGLQAAHNREVVHRDLKLGNIMLENGTDSVKIVDLGLAILKPKTRTGSHPAATMEGTTVGTPLYMAPEVALGKEVDHRTDIYSLGVLMYRLVTGVFPHEASSAVEIMSMHIKEDLIVPSDRVGEERKAYAQAFDELVMRAMEKEPEDRFQSIGELRTSLERIAGKLEVEISAVESSNVTIETEQLNLVVRPRESSERKQSWLMPVVAVISAVIGFGAVFLSTVYPNRTIQETPVEIKQENEYPIKITTSQPGAIVEMQRKSETGRYWWERIKETPLENIRLNGPQILRVTFPGKEDKPMILETSPENNVFELVSPQI
ncbi:serine/threonine protein kinase [Candidatus Micrarchaeota archaeon]|nr:serine/threonine protein kinase [Candidatus Micrarchaeota archaeon]